jgi:FkbM family methyltransferase
MTHALRTIARRVLPRSVRQALRAASPAALEDRIAARALERWLRRGGVGLALFDPEGGILKVPQSGAEAVADLGRCAIADAMPWLARVAPHVPQGGVVIDAGAYRGVTAQSFARRAAVVYAFEPLPESVASIESALALRGISNVEVIAVALSDRVGEAELHVCAVRGNNSLGPVATSRVIARLRVPTTTLDRFCEQRALPRVDFLKIDVEGYEHEVLRGASRLLRERSIGAILFEVSRVPLRSLGRTALPVLALLRDSGYRVQDLDGRLVGERELESCDQADFLALPSAEG